jgi:two-component system, NarL family, invasion response regulator UvrY
MVRILIADDHAVVRQGLKQILEEQPDMRIEGEAANGGEVLDLVGKGSWDVVLMDISMPGRNGLEILKDIHRANPRLPVLILSMHPESQYAVRALRNGAAGYLTKESAPQELVSAVRHAVSGRKYVSTSLAEQLASELEKPSDKQLHESLSDRELQILCMIASGKTPTTIAEELSLSVKTVSTYRTRILHKMKMINSAELTHYAIDNKLV